jgi:hypothetical protein
MMVGAVLFPIGLFWFAWCGNYPSVHWMVPTLSALLTGAGVVSIFLQALNYLIDGANLSEKQRQGASAIGGCSVSLQILLRD